MRNFIVGLIFVSGACTGGDADPSPTAHGDAPEADAAAEVATTEADAIDTGDTGQPDTGPSDTRQPETAPEDTAPDVAEATIPSPTVAFVAPSDGATVINPVTFTIAAAGVATVALDADGYALGNPWNPAASQTLTYTFNDTSHPRTVTLSGFDAGGALVASAVITVTVKNATAEGTVLVDAPYFYQYDNLHEPGSTCGITSGAMMVDTFHPGSVTPDSLWSTYGRPQGQSPAGLAALYEAEGLYADWTTAGRRADIRAHLDAGRPVAVHGWWTTSGHVTLIIGYDASDWIVNDPAGDWSNCYGCGGGKAVHYPLGGDWDSRMGGDGEVWWSTAADAPF